MLYTAPIDKITWDDIEAFCAEKIVENVILDYKKDFTENDKLARSIAAMANTNGGILLIGVDENNESKPRLPLKGIEFKRGLAERVANIDITRITPAVLPEVKVCRKLDDDSKAIVVIRIHESHQAPHAVSKNTKVYIRTGIRNNNEELADYEKIHWLQGRRKKAIELRESLYRKADERYQRLYDKFFWLNNSNCPPSPLPALMTLSACPLFPSKYYFNPPKAKELSLRLNIDDYYDGGGSKIPFRGYGQKSLYQNGYFNHYTSEKVIEGTETNVKKSIYAELNSYGLVYFRQGLLTRPIPRKNDAGDQTHIIIIRADEIFCRIDMFLEFSKRIFKEIGYYGALELKLSIENLKSHYRFLHCPAGNQDWWEHEYYPQDDHVSCSLEMPASELKDKKNNIVSDLSQQVAWSFGWELQRDVELECIKSKRGM